MKFDIHGGRLLPGHCEVHPTVHEDYPCFVCTAIKMAKIEKKYLSHGFHPDDPIMLAFPKVAGWLTEVSDTCDARAWSNLVSWCRGIALQK